MAASPWFTASADLPLLIGDGSPAAANEDDLIDRAEIVRESTRATTSGAPPCAYGARR